MDIFLERIIKKKKDTFDKVIIFGSIVLALVLTTAIISIIGPYGFSFILIMGVAYLAYYIISSRRIEYEYALTNGDLDIDKIVAQRKRKRVISANCKEFEIFARLTGDKQNIATGEGATIIKAVSSMDSGSVYFFTLNQKGKKTIVYFEPDDRMLNAIKTIVSRKVFQ